MKDAPPFKVTLDVSGDSEVIVEKWARDFLVGRGFNVTEPHGKWESVGDFKKRLGISYMTVSRKVKETLNRPAVTIQRGSQNRIIAILSNPDFDAYCVANK